MKRILTFFICLFLSINIVEAKTISVKFKKCVDGDTATFTYNGEDLKARFLAIDTPETKHPTKGEEPFGKEASNYTCERLKSATKIKLEYDSGSDEKDKYDRHLVWVFVDDSLLQEELISKGLAKVAYLYGDYKYTNKLKESEKIANDKKLGIWSDTNTSNVVKEETKQEDLTDTILNSLLYKDNGSLNYLTLSIIATIFIIILITNKKIRNKVIRKTKNKIKREILK